MTDAPTSTPTGGTSRSAARSNPNYAARRMLVSTVVITAIVVGLMLTWRAVNGGGSGVGGEPGTWDEIGLINASTGEVTTVDADGEVTGTHLPLGRVTATEVDGSDVALIGAEQVVLTKLDESEPIIIATERRSEVGRLAIDDSLLLVIGDPLGGNVQVVDGSTGEILNVGQIAAQPEPLMFAETLRHDTLGTAFAVADAANFQTILVRPEEVDATFYPDVPVAVGDEFVATSQVVGQRADVGLYDDEGKNLTVVPTAIPAGGVVIDDNLVFVSVDGGIFRVGNDDEEPTRLGAIAVPVGGQVRGVRLTLDGERLVLYGNVFQTVVKVDGTTVFTTTFTAPVDAPEVQPGWSCLAVGGGDSFHSLISLDSGEQLADLTGLAVTGASADGCTVIGDRGGVTELVTTDGNVSLGRVRMAELGPDGRSVVWQTTTGKAELVLIDDDLKLEIPIDLSASAPSNLAVVFIDR